MARQGPAQHHLQSGLMLQILRLRDALQQTIGLESEELFL